MSMARVGQGLQGSACCGGVVEDHARSGPGAGDGVADRDQDRPLGDGGPVGRGRIDGQHDDGVDPLVDQLGSQRLLEQRVVGGVDDQRLPPLLHQCATERGGHSLLPQVGQGAAHHADVTGASRDERAGDRVDLVAEPLRGLAYALLGLLGHLQTPQGVGDGSHRQADLVGHMLEGDPLGAFAHRADPSRGGTCRESTLLIKLRELIDSVIRFSEAIHQIVSGGGGRWKPEVQALSGRRASAPVAGHPPGRASFP